METSLHNGVVLAKTLELCQTLVSQPDFQRLRRDIDTFLADEPAKELYRTVAEKGEMLHQKQHQGQRLSDEEISDYERNREALMKNGVAVAFLQAQETMRGVQDTVTKYVTKTFELGRVPAETDFESCGHGCSCHH